MIQTGGLYCPDGLDYKDVVMHKQTTGTVRGYTNNGDPCREITNEELLALDVDMLIPAARECAIRADNAPAVRARIVAELANGPCTPDADQVLYRNGTFVIPDFLCNAGGVTVSYFEQVQNAYGYYWDAEMVYQRLDQKMTAAFHTAYEAAQQYHVDNRVAAYVVSVARVAEACKLRGWV